MTGMLSTVLLVLILCVANGAKCLQKRKPYHCVISFPHVLAVCEMASKYPEDTLPAAESPTISSGEEVPDHLEQIDFMTGRTQRDILVYLLHTFKERAGSEAVEDVERTMSVQGNRIVSQLISNALPVKMKKLETGSQAELVHAVNEFVPGENWSIGNMAAEKDVMAVAKLTDIIRQNQGSSIRGMQINGQNLKISIIPIIENKCFLRIKLKLNPGAQLDPNSFLSKLLVSHGIHTYLSPLKFMHQVALGLSNAYDKLKETPDFQNILDRFDMAEFEEHGAAVMVSFHEVPPSSSLRALLLQRKNLVPRLVVENGDQHTEGARPEQVIEPGTQVRVIFEKAKPADAVPIEDQFNGFREEMAADFDIVPAIHLPLWPPALNEWITRNRKWPSQQLIQKIVSEGVMVVHKAPKNGCELTDWRLSFSKAEILLISNTDFPCRQHAHRIFKSFITHMMRPAPKLITSYHCKTVLLWACERIPPQHWTWERLGFCVLGMMYK